MDIELLIADETERERALWKELQDAEAALAPYEARRKEACSVWCNSSRRLDALKLMRAELARAGTMLDQDAKVLASDRRELAELESHGSTCSQRMHTAAECTCGKADREAAEGGAS